MYEFEGGIFTRCYISRVASVRLTFLLPFGISAISELDEMNLKLGILEGFSGVNGGPPGP